MNALKMMKDADQDQEKIQMRMKMKIEMMVTNIRFADDDQAPDFRQS